MGESLQERLKRLQSSGGGAPAAAGNSTIQKIMADVTGEQPENSLQARLARIDSAVGEENKNVDISLGTRAKEKGFAADADQGRAFWEREINAQNPGRGLTVEADPSVAFGTNFFIKNRLGETIGETDPQGFQGLGELAKDVAVDLPVDLVRAPLSAGAIALGEAGGIAAAPFTAGTSLVAGPVLAGAAAEGGLEAARQGIGKMLGVNEELNPGVIGINALLGGAVPGAGQAFKAFRAGGLGNLEKQLLAKAGKAPSATGPFARGMAGDVEPTLRGMADGLPGAGPAEFPGPLRGMADGLPPPPPPPPGAGPAAAGAAPKAEDLIGGLAEKLGTKVKDFTTSPNFEAYKARARQLAEDLTDDVGERYGSTLSKNQKLTAKVMGSIFDKTSLGQVTPESMLVAFEEFTPEEQMFASKTVKTVMEKYAALNGPMKEEIHWLPYAKAQMTLKAAQESGDEAAIKAAKSALDRLISFSGPIPETPETITPFIRATPEEMADLGKTINLEWAAAKKMGLKTKLGQEITERVRMLQKQGGGFVSEWVELQNMLNAAEFNPVTGNPRTTVAKSLGGAWGKARHLAKQKTFEGFPEYGVARERMHRAFMLENARTGGKLSEMLRDLSMQNMASLGLRAATEGDLGALAKMASAVLGWTVGNRKAINYFVGAARKLDWSDPVGAVGGIASKLGPTGKAAGTAGASGIATEGAKVATGVGQAAAAAPAKSSAEVIFEQALKSGNAKLAQKMMANDQKLQQTFLGLMHGYFQSTRGSRPVEGGVEQMNFPQDDQEPTIPTFNNPQHTLPASAPDPTGGLTQWEASFLPPDPVEQIKQQTGAQSVVLNDRGRPAIMDPAERPVFAKHVAADPDLDESEAALVTASVLQDGEIVTPQELWDRRRDRRRVQGT